MSIRSLTQEDPIGLAGGLNLYGFANGDPVNFSDPFGLCVPPATVVCAALVLAAKAAAICGAVFGGTRVAYNALNDRPLGEGVQGDVVSGALFGATAGVGGPPVSRVSGALSAARAAEKSGEIGSVAVAGFSTDRLLAWLTALGRDVEIIVRTPRRSRQGRLRVSAA